MAATKEQIIEGLKKLSIDVDAHWTQDGAPDLNTLKELVGTHVKRGEVTAAAPLFNRSNPVFEVPVEGEVIASDAQPTDEGANAELQDGESDELADEDREEVIEGTIDPEQLSDEEIEDEAPTPERVEELIELERSLTADINQISTDISLAQVLLEEKRRAHEAVMIELEKHTPARRFEQEVSGYFKRLAHQREAATARAQEGPSILDQQLAARRKSDRPTVK